MKMFCKSCGKEFHNTDKNAYNLYCSRSCAYGKVDVLRICVECGKEFYVHPSVIAKGHGNCCSRTCFDNSRRLKVDCICKTCGEHFLVKPSIVNKGGGKYCSAQCCFDDRIGENSPNWRGGESIEYCYRFNEVKKEEIRELFNRKCYLCDKNEIDNKQKLSVHHVDYNKGQGCEHTWDLIPLCREHHIKTNYKRWYWFALLYNYWVYEYQGSVECNLFIC